MIIEAKGNKIVGIRNEEVQANTKLYKVVFQPTEKDDTKTIELNTLTASRMEAGEAQQKDYYYMEITHIPTGKTVFTYTDGKVWEYTEEFEMMILKKEEEKTMEKLLTKTQFTEIKEAIQKEVIKYDVEVQQPHPFYILIDISEDMFLEVDYFDQTTSEKNRGNFIVTLHTNDYADVLIQTKNIQDAFIEVIELVKEYGTEKEVQEMQTITSKDNKEIRIISATSEEATPFEMEVIEALNEYYILDEIEANGEIEVTTNGDYIELNGYEYLVFNNYEDAEQRAIEYAEEIIYDCGLTDNLILEADLQGLIDNQWFIDFWEEEHSYLAYEEGIEYIATEEEMEQMEDGELTADEVRENYFNSLQSSIKGQEIEEFKFQYGEEYFHDILIQENLIDIPALAKWCVDIDGVAHYLASYDFEEISENNLYLYRVN